MYRIFSKLFQPVSANKFLSSKLLLESSLGTFWFDILPLFTIPYLIKLIQSGNKDEFNQFVFLVLGAYVVMWLIHLFIRKWDYEAKYAYSKWVEETFRKKLILKDNLSMDVLGTGAVQSIIQKGMSEWVEAVWQILYQLPKVVLTLVAGLYIMKDLGWVFISLFFVFVLISSFGYTFYIKKRLKFDKKVNEIEDKRNAHSVRVIMSRQEIIFSGKENSETKELAGYADKQYSIAKNSAKYDFSSDWFISGIGTAFPFLGVLYILNTNLVNSVTSEIFVTFIYFTSRFSFNMYSMLWIVRQTLIHLPKIEKFWNFVEVVPELKNYNSGKEFRHGDGTIEFRNVGFEYSQTFNKNLFESTEDAEIATEIVDDKEKVVLEDFSLKISGGEKIALVGMSGSGKTTIAKLIVGYLKAKTGKILVDNQDLAEISLKSYYKNVGYLTQEPMVFDGSIKENMLYSANHLINQKDIDKKIEDSLLKANCEFVFKMKKGINTQIGEKGIRLSGGERQRLAIAKLFLKNPEIILLDEPTSALDSFSEEKITQSLEELFKGRTTIIIAHRLQTVISADRILVLENGKIIEEGNHEYLVEKNGVYAKMLAMQSGF